jgi:NADH-quinone oxidoreductase subunit C
VAAKLFDTISSALAPTGATLSVSGATLSIGVTAPNLRALVERLKSEFGFDLFLDVTAVDWPRDELRFEVVYHFYSTTDHVRVRVKTRVSAADPSVESLTSLYGAAGYMERECHEMYGIAFSGNPDLRPILLYEGFNGHPLRKDYPKQLEQPLVPYRK